MKSTSIYLPDTPHGMCSYPSYQPQGALNPVSINHEVTTAMSYAMPKTLLEYESVPSGPRRIARPDDPSGGIGIDVQDMSIGGILTPMLLLALAYALVCVHKIKKTTNTTIRS